MTRQPLTQRLIHWFTALTLVPMLAATALALTLVIALRIAGAVKDRQTIRRMV